jgi:hypothetical protein
MGNPMFMDPMLASMLSGGMAGMGGMGTGAPGAGAAANQDPPEVRFASQLQQLQDMGFYVFIQIFYS